MAGRKSQFDEMKLVERYSALSESFFKVLKKRLESKDEKKENWAVEQLNKAYSRMIPQNLDLTTKGKSITYTEPQINAIIDRYNRSRKS